MYLEKKNKFISKYIQEVVLISSVHGCPGYQHSGSFEAGTGCLGIHARHSPTASSNTPLLRANAGAGFGLPSSR